MVKSDGWRSLVIKKTSHFETAASQPPQYEVFPHRALTLRSAPQERVSKGEGASVKGSGMPPISLRAVFQILILDREDFAHFDRDAFCHTGLAILITDLDVV